MNEKHPLPSGSGCFLSGRKMREDGAVAGDRAVSALVVRLGKPPLHIVVYAGGKIV